MLSEEEVKHIAKLARIALTDEEVKKFAKQLSGVLEHVEILNELSTDEVEGTSQVTGLSNVTRKDEIDNKGISREELLKCSELPIDSKQIRVLPAIK